MAMWMLSAAALLLVIALAAQPAWQRWRRARWQAQVFPAAWRRILRRRVPIVARLPPARQWQLKRAIQVFLAEKSFVGCAGLEVTDEMRVTVAAQACLLLLGRPGEQFDALRQVLLYPGAFVVDRVQTGSAGVQREERRVLAGESWGQGQVILSWQEVLAGAADPQDGRNVVVHEFAHQLDQQNGTANGAPPLGSAAAHARWAAVMRTEFSALQARLEQGDPGLIDAYGATEPAEFFAVCSELFVERPAELASLHPAVYAELAGYYRFSPLQWTDGA